MRQEPRLKGGIVMDTRQRSTLEAEAMCRGHLKRRGATGGRFYILPGLRVWKYIVYICEHVLGEWWMGKHFVLQNFNIN
jgi:hypothetical protein